MTHPQFVTACHVVGPRRQEARSPMTLWEKEEGGLEERQDGEWGGGAGG